VREAEVRSSKVSCRTYDVVEFVDGPKERR
jgi:hypothetical protein